VPENRRPNSLRLKGFDYNTCGAYHITLSAYEMGAIFGELADHEVRLNPIGQMIAQIWEELPDHYPGVWADVYRVMPDHFHGIVVLVDPTVERLDAAPRTLSLSDVVHRFKSYTTTLHRRMTGDSKLWKRGYWDEIINSDPQLKTVRQYIYYNALKDYLKRTRQT